MPNETVAQFASDIRRLSHRLDLSSEQSLTTFVQGLRPELKNYVVLQRPKTFAEAKNHAKLKETLPDDRPIGRTDEILKAIAMTKPSVAAYDGNNSRTNHSHERPLGRDDIVQLIRQEFRRPGNQQLQGPDYRNQRTFDGRPICNYCRKPGHVAYVCRKGQFENRDPRLPVQNDTQMNHDRRPGNSAPHDRQN